MKPRVNPLMATLIFAGLAFAGLSLFAGLWGEKLWFDTVEYGQVFSIQFWTTIALFLAIGGFVAVAIATNMAIAYRLRAQTFVSGQSELLDRYRDMLGRRWKSFVLGTSIVFGILAGLASFDKVLPLLAWLNATSFGTTDTRFDLDISFFVFTYPVLRYLLSLLMEAMIFGTLAAAIVHFATGSLVSPRGRKRMPASLGHLSFNFGLILIIFGAQTLLERYGLMISNGTLFTGLHYTGDRANLTANLVLAVIAFLVGALFMVNAWLNRPRVALSAMALMIISGLILSLAYPALIQAFEVRPDEPDFERPYIEKHVQSTRAAYDISDVDIKEYAAVTQVRPGQLKADAAALPGIRLMDPSVVPPAFEQFQQVRGYYSFPPKLDVDRYSLNGVHTDAIVAAREIDIAGVKDKNWNNIHTVYTHGFGLVAAYGNKRQPGGEPEWIARNIPPVGELAEHEPRIYYGERSSTFAIVGRPEGAPAIEFDTPGSSEGGGENTNVFAGKGGVPIGGMFHRLIYALKFGDINLMLSDRVTPVSKILFDRTPKERVEKVAPWLETDSDPYPIVADGRVKWVVDAYTVSGTYPNSQRVSLRDATTDTQSRVLGLQDDRTINYIRNSVKAVVDAYDGSVTLYAWDDKDPILQTYSKVFPGTVKPKSEIPPDVLSHLRYPTDLFKVQREILARYHMTDPGTFYTQSDLWQVPPDPAGGKDAVKEPAYYLSIKWPGEKEPAFSLTTVYTPNLRQNLASYMAVNADASSPDYGKIRILRMSDNQQIDGPGQTFNAINTNQLVAEKLRPFLNEGAADAQYGNLLTLPMGNGLMYVEPIYTKRPGASGSYPILKFVVVRFGEHIGIGETLQEALDMVFGGDAGTDTGEKPQTTPPGEAPPKTDPGGPPPTGQVNEPAVVAAIEKAKAAYAEAEAALKAGDLGTYQKKNAEARAAVDEALKAAGR